MKRNFLALLIFILITPAVWAQSTVDIGIVGVGARPLGMGKAFVAVSDDTNAVFLNPAGIVSSKSWGLTSMTTKILNTIDYKMFGAVYPAGKGVFGVGYIGAASPAGYKTDATGAILDPNPMSYNSNFFIVTYGIKINSVLSTGLNFKLIQNGFNNYDASATGYDADFGILAKPNKKLSLGINLQNFLTEGTGGNVSWDSSQKEGIPTLVKIGAAYKAREDLLLALDVDFPQSDSTPTLLHAGVEWKPTQIIALRAGVDQSPQDNGQSVSDLTLGIGFNYRGFTFDYAYKSNSYFDNTNAHYFSLSYAPKRNAQ